jgi:membrane protein
MASPEQLRNWFLALRPVSTVISLSKKIILPGFEGIPLYTVACTFINGLTKGYLTTRAAAISFSVFLAIFPFLIFLFSIIPFIPVQNFQPMLLDIIRDFLPQMAFESVKETIIDIITRPRSSILFLNLLLTLYFSTNGVNSLMEAFNNTYHNIETRPWLRQYGISVMIVLINSFLLILSIGLMTFGSGLLLWIIPEFLDNSLFLLVILQILRWVIILSLLLFAISFVYYFAPVRKKRFSLISPGSLFATFLIIITTLGFNFYVDHFSTYNALYGSLGTLMIVLFWIYINAISLLVGFELDASIRNAGS